jgi:hypothetical protein
MFLRRILTSLQKAIRLVIRLCHPVFIPAFSGLPVVITYSGVSHTIPKSYITAMIPAFVVVTFFFLLFSPHIHIPTICYSFIVPCLFLHT